MTTAAAVQEYQTVNLSQLTESPTNPRKTFDAQALNEMAENIKAIGILQPIIVRQTEAEGQFEIIAGARRYRAAKIAGVEEVPVRVRQMTDADVLVAQVVENLIRADVQPYEETQGFLALMRLDPARFTAEELAARTGKSKTFIVHRLKLADLIPAAAEALQKDEIALGHALELARLTPKQQEEALPHCFATDYMEGGNHKRLTTVPQFARYIQNNIILELAEAPFNREDAGLYPEAGACANCPKRSGFNLYLFDDVKHDSCFDPECYTEKINRHIATCGLVQIAGDYRAVPEDSTAVPRNRYTVVKESDSCGFATKGIVAIGHNTGTVMTVCTSLQCDKHTGHRPAELMEDDDDGDTIDYQKQNRIEAQVKKETAALLREEITQKVSEVPTDSDMELLTYMVAFACEEHAEEFLVRWGAIQKGEDINLSYEETVNLLLDHLASINGKTRLAVIFDMLLFAFGGCDMYSYRESRAVAKAAELYHINVENVEKQVRRKIEAESGIEKVEETPEPTAEQTGELAETATIRENRIVQIEGTQTVVEETGNVPENVVEEDQAATEPTEPATAPQKPAKSRKSKPAVNAKATAKKEAKAKTSTKPKAGKGSEKKAPAKAAAKKATSKKSAARKS
jgi:ParB family chromosome partitioning protein